MKKRNVKGYTLIELIISMAIISILISIIAVITNSFYKSYRISYINNERLEEKNYIISQFNNIVDYANEKAIKITIENNQSLDEWSIKLENKVIFSYKKVNSSFYNINNELIKKFNRIIDIKISYYSGNSILVEIYFDNNEKEILIKNIINNS